MGIFVHRGVIAIILAALASCGDPAPRSSDGKVLFDAICARCHAVDGRGDPVEKARLGVPDMTDPRWQAARTDADIRRTIVEGSKSKKMPAFGHTAFNEAQLAALVAYVRARRAP
jgi:cytochrome c oxidase cbb3-type subunit 3